jgi:hypothetical protein
MRVLAFMRCYYGAKPDLQKYREGEGLDKTQASESPDETD